MPNRILREGILTSQRVDRLSEGAEVFYRRLMSRLDDHGRCEAHPELLRTSCYPLRVDRVKAKQISGWLRECEKAALVFTYTDGQKRYLQALDWRQQTRSDSKCPAPDEQMLRKCYADAMQMIANAHLGVVVGVVVSEGVIASRPRFEDDDATASPVDKSDENSTPANKGNGSIMVYIPLVDNSEYPITNQVATELSTLYPAVDVPQTLNEIRAWNLANPNRRKTRRGVLNHINNWLSKEQNRGPKG